MAKQATIESPGSSQRDHLAQAKRSLDELATALSEAADENDAAKRMYYRARSAIEDAQEGVRAARSAPVYAPKFLEDINARIMAAEVVLEQSRLPLPAALAAADAAEAKLKAAEQHCVSARGRMETAADAVLRAAAGPAAAILVQRINEAFAILADVGPDLDWLISNKMLGEDPGAAKEAYNRLYTNPAALPGYRQKCRANAWSIGHAALRNGDALAALPI